MVIRRHQMPGETTADQLMTKRGWILKGSLWELPGKLGGPKLSTGLVDRIWQEQGPRKLEMLVAQKERE